MGAIKLGVNEFSSRTAARRMIKAWLAESSGGQVEDPEQLLLLLDLIACHPDSKRKIGCGIRAFYILRNKFGSGASFALERTDGIRERFSYHKCLGRGRVVRQRELAVEAFRNVVRDQMIASRRLVEQPARSGLSGEAILDNDESEIDHRAPFRQLLEAFCQAQQVRLEDVETTGDGAHTRLKDTQLAKAFCDFHAAHARLPTVHQAVHGNHSSHVTKKPAAKTRD